MDSLNQIERIKIKLRLAKHTDRFFEVFGARSHEYVIAEPLTMAEVEAFETQYGISLPIEYKNFLTQIANGGIEYVKSVVGNSAAGPDYGVFKLGHPYHLMGSMSADYLNKEPFFNSQLTEAQWSAMYNSISDDASDEEYDHKFAEAYAGILTIGYSGCAGYIGIVLSGMDVGKVVYIYDDLEYCPQLAKENNFLDWYESWLDKIISGKSIMVGKPFMTEEQSFARYNSATETYWRLVALSYIRTLTTLSSEYLKQLWDAYTLEQEATIKLYLLNLLVKFDYEKAKDELTKLYKTEPMEFLKNLHLYAPDKTAQWQDVITVMQQSSEDKELLEYIQYVTLKDGLVVF